MCVQAADHFVRLLPVLGKCIVSTERAQNVYNQTESVLFQFPVFYVFQITFPLIRGGCLGLGIPFVFGVPSSCRPILVV